MQTLSVCMIVKNEQEFIRDCLESVKSVAREIIIVDTGCSDKTIEIAREFTDKIVPFKWVDDFSAARNASIKEAKSDWILWIDADERLRPESLPSLKKILTEVQKPVAYVLSIWNMLADKKNYKISGAHRLFTNHKGLYFTGRIHEQIVQSLAEKGGEEKKCDVTLIHLGYGLEKEAQNKKHERNRKLLLRMVKEEPQNAYAHFTLAQNYSLTLDWGKALKHYQSALKHHRFETGMEAALLNTYGEALMKTGHLDRAKEMALKSVAKINEQAGGYYLLYKLAESSGDKREALEWLLKLFKSTLKLRTSAKTLSTDILLNQEDLIFEIAKLYNMLSEPQQTLQWLNKLSTEKKRRPEILLLKAKQFLHRNEYTKAIECLENPVLSKNASAFDLLGLASIKLQDWKRASQAYEKLLEIRPHDVNLIKRLAGVYAKNGQIEKTQALIAFLNKIN